MLNRKLTLTFILALATPLLASPLQERQLKDSDLKKLAEKLGDFMEAKKEKKGIAKTEVELGEVLEKLTKKLKGGDPLALPSDMGRALWLSQRYDKARTKKGKLVDETFEDTFIGGELTFAVWTPKSYNPKSQAYPLIITIPEDDPDLSPSDHIGQKWTDATIRENAILVAPTMPDDVSTWGQAGSPGEAGGLAHVLTTLRTVLGKYAVDPDRIYLSGRGAGVAAALSIASYFPDRFAGVIGRSGDPGLVAPHNMGNLPTYFAAAGGGATSYQTSVKEAGFDNCTLDPEGDEASVWSWIEEHPRAANPTEVTLVPGSPFPVRAYWVRVPPSTETDSRLDARIDRATNTIHVDATGIANMTLYLNDDLVDLSQPVTVICNGQSTTETIPRNLKLTLQLMFDAVSDPGRVFVAAPSYSVSE